MSNSTLGFGKLLMKSNVISFFMLAGVLGLGYFFIDAFTPNVSEIVADQSLAAEDGAKLYVPKEFNVKTLNGHSVKWRPKFTAKAIVVLFSPGHHAFTLDFATTTGNTNLSAKGLEIEANFMPGVYYRFNYTLEKDNKISYSINESNPVTYKVGFDPNYIIFIVAVIAFIIAFIFVMIARKKGKIYNISG